MNYMNTEMIMKYEWQEFFDKFGRKLKSKTVKEIRTVLETTWNDFVVCIYRLEIWKIFLSNAWFE